LRCLRLHLLGQFVRGRAQCIHLGFDGFLVVGLERFLGVLDRGFNRCFIFGADFVALFGERLLHRVNQVVALVACIHQFALLAIFFGMRFAVAHHLLDFFVRQTGVGLDGDLGFLAAGLVLGRYMQDAVGVDVEGHFDLRHAAR